MSNLNVSEWYEQWKMFRDDEGFLFSDWIHPNKLEDFTSVRQLAE